MFIELSQNAKGVFRGPAVLRLRKLGACSAVSLGKLTRDESGQSDSALSTSPYVLLLMIHTQVYKERDW